MWQSMVLFYRCHLVCVLCRPVSSLHLIYTQTIHWLHFRILIMYTTCIMCWCVLWITSSQKNFQCIMVSSPPVPQPNVALIRDTVTVNSVATLRCTVTLDESIDCSQVIISLELIGGAAKLAGSTFSNDFMFSATMSNAGSYRCRATITSNNQFVQIPSPVTSGDATLFVVG